MRISIHALREEGDATHGGLSVSRLISIHALREEGDNGIAVLPVTEMYFYPRPPRGGRRCASS